MDDDAFEPTSAEDLIESLREHLESFEVAFGQGPTSKEQVIGLWEKTLELKVECEQFYEFLLKYSSVISGLLWAHYPEEYREKVYDKLQETRPSQGPFVSAADVLSQRPTLKTMLVFAEEVFLARDNRPLSIGDLIEEMRRRGIRFKAKEPAKSLAQTMKNSGRFEALSRGIYHLKR
ncbi:MAG: hypothetical protein V3T61_06260 [Acidobacteriota bacterium]